MNMLPNRNCTFFIRIAYATMILLASCGDTEGTLKIKGIVLDESTHAGIPRRNIIVQGLVQDNKKLVPIYAGQFSCDSSGSFEFSLRKIKDAFYYNFCLVGDSAYPFTTTRLPLTSLKNNTKNTYLYLSKLADLTIIIIRKSKIPVYDTLSLTWQSNGVYGRFLYPYKINNYEKSSNSFNSEMELRWIGGKVNSEVKTKVFANKKTRLQWDLDRNGRREEFIDTITCKRDIANIVYFTY